MSFEPVTLYRCVECGRIYQELPERCVCKRTMFIKGEQIGSFIVIRRVEDSMNLIAKCILCGSLREVHYSNIRRQKSCGCKPRRITIVTITPDQVVYTCSKCGESHIIKPPIASYCCSDLLELEELDEIDN